MPTRLSRSRALALAALALFAACTDRGPTEVAPPEGEQVEARISCTVSVRDQQVRCGDPVATKGPADIILGGQGTYVRLQSSNTAYDGAAGEFSVDVTVQNLLPQPMGTPDGVTATGMKIFFDQMPTATEGTGEVTVANADGTGQFMRADQPYFEYAEMLQPRGMSQPRAWRFNVPATVERFSFTVYVHTQLPAEDGVLRWRSEAGAAYSARSIGLYGVWAASPTDVFVVGAFNIFHWDGNEWTSQWFSNSNSFRDVAGSSRDRLFAGGGNGMLYLYDGNRWAPVPYDPAYGPDEDGFAGSLEGVWARGDTVVAVGWGAAWDDENFFGKILRSTDAGATMTISTDRGPANTRQLWDVSGPSTADLWVAGYDDPLTAADLARGVILHSTDGGDTWTEWVHGGDRSRRYGGVWAGPGLVVVTGGQQDPETGSWEGVITESHDGGGTWTETLFNLPGGNCYIREVWRAPDGTMHAVGDGGIAFINTGGGWIQTSSATASSLYGLHGAGGEAFAVGVNGTLVRYHDGAWTQLNLKTSATGTLRSVWGAGPHDVYAVGHKPGPGGSEQTLLMHNDGTVWSVLGTSSDSTQYVDIWGTSGSNVYVVGHRLQAGGGSTGMIWHFDGAAWAAVTPTFAGTERQLTAVWGSGPGDVWVLGRQAGPAGDQIVMLHSTDGGTSWTESTWSNGSSTPGHVADVWGSGPSDIYAVGHQIDASTSLPRSLVLHYDGGAWTGTNHADTTRLTGVWGSDAGNVFVTGLVNDFGKELGLVRWTVDGGSSWTQQRFSGQDFQLRGLRAIWGTSATDVYAVGAGPVMHFDGTAWREQGSQAWPILQGVWGSSPTNVFAVGEKGAILHGTR